jgi:phosphoglycerate kinase (EC 2.7.2.3)
MDSIQFTNEKVLMRVDFNVPLNKEHQITDDTRIRAALPTIKKVINEGGSVILMSHLGRPKIAKNGQADVDKFTLKYLIPHLSELLGVEVQFSPQTVGAKANAMATNLKPGEVLLVENTRFEDGETKGDTALAEAMSELGSFVYK